MHSNKFTNWYKTPNKPVVAMASEQQVKRLQEEKAKLTEEAERAKNIIKTSEACKDLITYIADNHKKDPFVDPGTCLLFLFA